MLPVGIDIVIEVLVGIIPIPEPSIIDDDIPIPIIEDDIAIE